MGRSNGQVCIQYGCGVTAPNGWVNFDASPTLRLQKIPIFGRVATNGRVTFPQNVRYGDVVKGLPIADASADLVYCSHVLEHLSHEDCRIAIRETHRILRPGGIFRGVLPDLERIAKDYLENNEPSAAIRFMEDSLLGLGSRRRGVRGIAVLAFGNSRHLWMWDFKALAAELETLGFHDIRRAQFSDSVEPAFGAVEQQSRWDGCLGFECRK